MIESPYFDKNGKQLKIGNIVKSLKKIGKNSRGNGKKFFYNYYIIYTFQLRYIAILLNKNLQKEKNRIFLYKIKNKYNIIKKFTIIN